MGGDEIFLIASHDQKIENELITNGVPYSKIRRVYGESRVFRAYEALEKLLSAYSFQTVLDIGCGEGIQADRFIREGKTVTTIDYGNSVYAKKNKVNNLTVEAIIADFNSYNFHKQFDCVWCSHILKHQYNPHEFLKKIHEVLRENGVLAITVPPMENRIVGGHLSYWNAGMLLYHLVLAGFDCNDAIVKTYGYNVSVILRKKTVNVEPFITFDGPDIGKIQKYLPAELCFNKTSYDIQFDGNIESINWD